LELGRDKQREVVRHVLKRINLTSEREYSRVIATVAPRALADVVEPHRTFIVITIGAKASEQVTFVIYGGKPLDDFLFVHGELWEEGPRANLPVV
jgi:hypothetical protein